MRFGILAACATLFVAGLVATCLARVEAAAQSLGPQSQGPQSLSLVTGEDYPPFVDARQPGGGLAVLLIQQVVDRMGDIVILDTAPWRRGYEETLRGRYDATFPYVRTAEREREFLYSDPLFSVRPVVFMPAERRFAYGGPADLRGKRVCGPLGYALPEVLQSMIQAGEVERVMATSAAACPGLLVAGRVDFIIQDLRIGSALIAKVGLMQAIVTVSEPPLSMSDIHLIVPRNRVDAAALIARFNAALARVRASGDYDRLLAE